MTRPFRLGLTGSIGMGKSTTAQMFAEEGVPVWDADATVHRLYDGPAAKAIAEICPQAVVSGRVDRAVLRDWIASDRTALAQLEGVVHPLVTADREAFLRVATDAGAPLVLLDIPLLFETGADTEMDATLVVTAPAEVQRARVLARPDMTEDRLRAMLARQMPDKEKRARATHVIETLTHDDTRAAVRSLIEKLTGGSDA
jgi:dephospho-CoA kinase